MKKVLKNVVIKDVDVEPHVSSIENGFNIALSFVAEKTLEVSLEVKYVFDAVRKKPILLLGRTLPENVESGKDSTILFSTGNLDRIRKEIAEVHYSNTGFILMNLLNREGDVLESLKVVTRVSASEYNPLKERVFTRRIFNPFQKDGV